MPKPLLTIKRGGQRVVLVPAADVRERLGCSPRTFERRVRDPRFPQPVVPEGSRLRYFVQSEIDDWFMAQVELRRWAPRKRRVECADPGGQDPPAAA